MSGLFVNAPLVQAIFQVRFPGEIAIELARPAFQSAVREELPNLFVPKAQQGVAPALQGYTFRDRAGNESIDLALNAFTYSTRVYPGFGQFKARFQHFLGVLTDLVPLKELSRIGLRYVNHIPVLRSGPHEPIPIDDYLNIGFRLPGRLGGAQLTALNGVFNLGVGGGSLRVLIEHKVLETPTRDEVIVLDFDFSQQDGLHVPGLEDYLDRAHTETKDVFLSMISPKYLTVLRGEAE